MAAGQGQRPEKPVGPSRLPDTSAFSQAWAVLADEAPALVPSASNAAPEDLPTRPDVDWGMAPAPASIDGLITFKIMTMGCGLARIVTSLSCSSRSVPFDSVCIFK